MPDCNLTSDADVSLEDFSVIAYVIGNPKNSLAMLKDEYRFIKEKLIPRVQVESSQNDFAISKVHELSSTVGSLMICNFSYKLRFGIVSVTLYTITIFILSNGSFWCNNIIYLPSVLSHQLEFSAIRVALTFTIFRLATGFFEVMSFYLLSLILVANGKCQQYKFHWLGGYLVVAMAVSKFIYF